MTDLFQQLPTSVLQMGAIFLSIMIEALPFVLIGSIISGFIDVYITPDRVHAFLPQNKILRILFGTFVGFVFPSCECGIVPIVNRFLEKKVPTYTAVPFLATAPIINPIVLFATYTAFGNSVRFAFFRALGSILVALVLGIFWGFMVREPILKQDGKKDHSHDFSDKRGWAKVGYALIQAIDEFFDMGRYLVWLPLRQLRPGLCPNLCPDPHRPKFSDGHPAHDGPGLSPFPLLGSGCLHRGLLVSQLWFCSCYGLSHHWPHD